MAIRPDDAATLAKGVAELYSEAETTLLQRIAAALAKGNDAPDWAETKLLGIQALRAQADGILVDLGKNVPGAVERAVGIAYNRGIATAGGDLAGAGLASGAFAEVTPTGAAAAIVSDTMARLTPMSFQIRRAVTDVYQQVVTQVAAQTALGTITRREASAKILTRLASQGVTGFRDVAGRQWAMSSYAEMAARTSAANAMLQGHTDRITDLGIDTVIVSNAPENCSICAPFEGKVLSLSGRTTGRLRDGKTVIASLAEAKGKGLFHPNCRHSHSIYLPGITKGPGTDLDDPEGNALRVKQRAYERRVRELKREDAIAQEFGGPAAKQARAKLNAKTAEFRDWRTAHDRKNLSYRTSISAPKSETPFAAPTAAPTQPRTPTPGRMLADPRGRRQDPLGYVDGKPLDDITYENAAPARADADFRYIADPDSRATGMLQYFMETEKATKQAARNIATGKSPLTGVDLKDMEFLLTDGYTADDLTADLVAGATRLEQMDRKRVPLGTVYKGIQFDQGTTLEQVRAGLQTKDLRFTSVTPDRDLAERYAGRPWKTRSVVLEIEQGEGLKLNSVGDHAIKQESLFSGDLEVLDITEVDERIIVKARAK